MKPGGGREHSDLVSQSSSSHVKDLSASQRQALHVFDYSIMILLSPAQPRPNDHGEVQTSKKMARVSKFRATTKKRTFRRKAKVNSS